MKYIKQIESKEEFRNIIQKKTQHHLDLYLDEW